MLRIFRSWTLQRYVLREFIISFLLALTACTLLMLLGVFFMKANDYEDFGVTTGQVAMLFPFLMPRALSWAVPPAAMIAVTIVFGRLSAENEILAAQAGGAPLRILAFPLFFCGILLAAFCLWCNQGLLHWGNSTIRNEIFKIDSPDFFSNLEKPGNSVALKPEGGGVVHINWLPWDCDPKTGATRKPIHIAYFQNQEVGQTVVAKDYHADYHKGEAGARILILTLRDAQVYGERQQQAGPSSQSKPNLTDMQSYCKEFTLEITLPQPSKLIDLGESRGEKGWWENYSTARQIKESYPARRKFMLQRAAEFGAQAVAGSPADPAAVFFVSEGWSETRVASDAAYGSGGARDRAQAEEAECFRKLGLSLLPLSTVILGIGLGLLVRKSQRLIGFLLGIVVYTMLYYPMMIVSKELARTSRLPLWTLFLPNLLLLLLGYGLWRAYERGWLENVSDGLARVLGSGFSFLRDIFGGVIRLASTISEHTVGLFRKKTDGYVTGSFAGPLIIVLLVFASLLTAMDLFQHGEEVIDGVVRAAEPLAGKIRTQPEAVVDILTYYGIRSLEMICDILPLLILLAGIMCVTVLVRNNEHLIFKSSGVPLQRAFRPIIRTTLLFSLAVTALRETAMPQLIMLRDYLKPLVYHRSASPTALAIHTYDANGREVMFQMSKYSSGQREGSNLRIYELEKNSRMPVTTADRAYWNGEGWSLRGDPAKYVVSADSKVAARPVPVSGFRVTQTNEKGGPILNQNDDIRPLHTTRSAVPEWRGAVTPAYVECERLGAGVMSLPELWSASKIRPELKVEWWRRVSEWTLAVFLLWVTIPLMVSEVRGPVAGVAWSIGFGGASWFLNMACAEAGRTGYLPCWAPLIPPLLFFVLGVIHYYRKMPT